MLRSVRLISVVDDVRTNELMNDSVTFIVRDPVRKSHFAHPDCWRLALVRTDRHMVDQINKVQRMIDILRTLEKQKIQRELKSCFNFQSQLAIQIVVIVSVRVSQ